MTDIERTDRLVVLAMGAGANKERRRIRRLIAPHLRSLRGHDGPCRFSRCETCQRSLKAISNATRAPRKVRGKR